MHPSALRFGSLFFSTYCTDSTDKVVIDIGSQDVNGSLRSFCPEGTRYIGVDFVEGDNVDVVLKDPYKLPFEDESIDFIVCSSVFEHSQFFWLLFLEIIRILKPSGTLYLNVPSNGYIHRYPVDCWRFYPDSGLALIAWAERNGYSPALLESFIADKHYSKDQPETWWNDYVAVFVKNRIYQSTHKSRMLKGLNSYSNAFCDDPAIDNKTKFLTDDFLLITSSEEEKSTLNGQILVRDKEIAVLITRTLELQGKLDELTEEEKRHAYQLQTLENNHVQHSSQKANERAEQEQLHQSQLAQARQQIEAQLIQLAEREAIFSSQLQTLQQTHDQTVRDKARERAEQEQLHQSQLAQARQQIEDQHVELNKREVFFSTQLQAKQNEYNQQKRQEEQKQAEQEQLYKVHRAQVQQQIDAEIVANEQVLEKIKRAHKLEIEKLENNINLIKNSFFWKILRPIFQLQNINIK